MARRIIGFVNPDGSGIGNWSHASDADEVIGHLQHYHTRKGRVLKLARRTPRTIQALPLPSVERDTRIPPVRLLNILLAVAFLEVMVIVWALSELGVIHV